MNTTMTTASPIAPLLHTDGYKVGHTRMYPAGLTRLLSNYTNRGTRMEGIDQVVHFGLQAYLQKFLVEEFAPFFAADEDEVCRLYQETMDSYLGPGIGTDHIRALHRLGYLPLRFCAVPEGTLMPLRVPTFTVENTHPDFAWLTNYIESALSASVWHASTVATIANQYRELLDDTCERQGGAAAAVDFQAHDFSFRGQTSVESAQASGAAHLLSFLGTDSLPALDWIRRYYPGDNGLVAASVPASEHSVMVMGGRDGEFQTYERLIDTFQSGILSLVSDTYNLWTVVTDYLPRLKDTIMSRDMKVVIRPDSGDPVDILAGTWEEEHDWILTEKHIPEYIGERETPAGRGVVELLWEIFGGTVNDKGLKELDPHIGTIYGDSITLERAQAIIDRLEAKGFAASNVVFGVGSYSYQGLLSRDTFNTAVKATWAEIDGQPTDLIKDPITDSGLKKSATGRLAVLRNAAGQVELVEHATPEQEENSLLQPVWENGRPLVTQSFADVREVLRSAR